MKVYVEMGELRWEKVKSTLKRNMAAVGMKDGSGRDVGDEM
jgi:hypothetical protein